MYAAFKMKSSTFQLRAIVVTILTAACLSKRFARAGAVDEVIFTTLCSFDGTNGANSIGGLVQGTDGGFYGTTFSGGDDGVGTVFKVTTNGTLTRLFSFSNRDGAAPKGKLT